MTKYDGEEKKNLKQYTVDIYLLIFIYTLYMSVCDLM